MGRDPPTGLRNSLSHCCISLPTTCVEYATWIICRHSRVCLAYLQSVNLHSLVMRKTIQITIVRTLKDFARRFTTLMDQTISSRRLCETLRAKPVDLQSKSQFHRNTSSHIHNPCTHKHKYYHSARFFIRRKKMPSAMCVITGSNGNFAALAAALTKKWILSSVAE